MKIHHIGYLVKKIEKAAAAFEAMGYVREGGMTHDEYRKVDILFLEKDGYRIELVSPYAPDSVVAGLIKTYKNAPYHICYETEDFAAELAALENGGCVRMDEPAPAPAIGGRRVTFLMHAAMGMLELLEPCAPDCGQEAGGKNSAKLYPCLCAPTGRHCDTLRG